jgi:hypothetical protein
MDTLDRMVEAVERVRERLQRAAGALDAAGVQFAVVGGNAVAAWVAQIDSAAVRNTQDVDILLRREDLSAADDALRPAGFVYRRARNLEMFLDGPNAKARDALYVVFAGERVLPDSLTEAPRVSQSQRLGSIPVVNLDALVTMKLTAFRLKDRVHLLDMVEVGLLDASWPERLAPILGARLQSLIDDPDQ